MLNLFAILKECDFIDLIQLHLQKGWHVDLQVLII